MRARLAGLLLVLLFAGCFGGSDVPAERSVTAAGGRITEGWAYDGVGIAPASATLEGQFNDPDNTGVVNVGFDFGGSRWTITFDRFAQAEGRDFQDGGIEFSIDEHGDTGVADASIPRIHALIAAWGTARVERGGELVTPEPWTAHLMVSADTVRGADGKITKADGATPYDPATPADARRIEGDPQALLFIKHPQGEDYRRGIISTFVNLSCAGPQCAQTAEIPLEEGGATFSANLTFRADGQLPIALAPQGAEVVIVDANGVELVRAASGPIGGPVPTVSTAMGELAGIVGPLTATVTGDGAFGVSIEFTAQYADTPFLVLTWDEVTVS